MSELEDVPIDAPDEGGVDTGETPAEEAERLYAGKYTSPDELEKAYLESQQMGTKAAQEAAEARAQLEEFQNQPEQPAEEWFDPRERIGSTLDQETEDLLAARIWENPQGMMEWALRPETQQQFGPTIVARVFKTWQGNNPWDAGVYQATHGANQSKAELEDLRTQFQQEQQARQQENILKSATLAKDMVLQNLPDFGTYRERVVELFDIHQLRDDHPLLQTPEGQAEFTRQMYQIARGEEFDRQQAAAAAGEEPTPAKAAGAKARTSTRSSASGNARTNDPVTQALLDAQAFAQAAK